MTFPCRGRISSWELTDVQIVRWRAQFPRIEIEMECRKAQAWVEANPRKRKTAAGMLKFLAAWLTRTADQMPATPRRLTASQAPVYVPWTCPHVEPHVNRWRCEQATILGRARTS